MLPNNAERAHVVHGQHGVLAAEADIDGRPAGAFLGGACKQEPELGI